MTRSSLVARSVIPAVLSACLAACGAAGGGPRDGGGTAPDARGVLDAGVGGDGTSGDGAGTDATRAGIDVAPLDAHAGGGDGAVCGCGAAEICGDGYDNNCDGRVDEMCPCLPGTTQRCLNGTPSAGAPLCAFGQQACEGSGEFGSWGACAGVGALADASGTAIACRRIVILGAPGADPSANFQAWLEMNGAVVTRTQTTASDGTLPRALLDTFDLAIIDWLQRDYTVDEANTLRDWVAAGGGLIAMSGHDSGATADRQVSLLQSIGMTYVLGMAYSGPATLLPSTAINPTSAAYTVTFNGGMQVATTPAYVGSTPQVVATVPNGGAPVTVGETGTLGAGYLFVFGDEWIEFDSEWSTMMTVPQLWFSSVNEVSPHPGHPLTSCE